jgi:hypothetical protein
MILTFRAGEREWNVVIDNKYYKDFDHEENKGHPIELLQYE